MYVDHKWRNRLKHTACVYLYGQGAADVGAALFYATIENVTPDASGTQHAAITAQSYQDLLVLRHATRSHTGSDMPGMLDKAFEAALPGHEWPIFHFGVADAACKQSA